jgi:DNA-binding transcriptional regulator YdaS (Cro superfamily)
MTSRRPAGYHISLNDERGTDGQSKFARLLGWHHSTVWRKLNGKSKITSSDALAIIAATEAELSKTDNAPARI